jgi:hypothetical protein
MPLSTKPTIPLPRNLKPGDVLTLRNGMTRTIDGDGLRMFSTTADGIYDMVEDTVPMTYFISKKGAHASLLPDWDIVGIERKNKIKEISKIEKALTTKWVVMIHCKNREHARVIKANVDNGARKITIKKV